MKITFSILLSLIAFSFAFSQTPDEDMKKYTSLFPGKPTIFTKSNETVKMSVEGDNIVITSYYDDQLFFTDDNASFYSKKNIYYSGFYEIGKIEAYSEIPNGKKYKKNKVYDFSKNDEIGTSYIFHDDVKSIGFYFSGLEKGAKSNLQYSKTYKEPHFFGSFQFQQHIPIAEAEFTIYVPSQVELGYTLFGTDEQKQKIEFTQEPYKEGIKYTWKAMNMPAVLDEENAPSYSHIAPHIQVYIKKYTTESGKIKTIYNDVSTLHEWYAYLLQHTPQDLGNDFKAVCDSIDKSSPTELDKVKNVFYWVQDNINYIAFEAGLNGFVPRGANSVFEKKYGDCKDMANIIVTMLAQMGITAHHTWIGSRDIPYTYNEVPTTACDNHMIATYIDSVGNPIFLDATSQMLPFGMPSSFTQGKQALVNKVGDKPYALFYVPTVDAKQNSYVDSTYLTIDNKTIIGSSKITIDGYKKQRLNQRFRNGSSKKNKETIEKYIRKGSNAYVLTNHIITNKDERDKPLIINADFTIKSYVTALKDEIFLNLNLDFLDERYEIEKDRKLPQEYNQKAYYKIVNVLEIPKGYTLSHIPENSSHANELVSYTITYKKEGNNLIYTVELQSNMLMVEPSQFNEMIEFVKSFRDAYNECIILKKN